MYTVYHRTSLDAAVSIVRDGFRDATGTYMTRSEHTGVWVSDCEQDPTGGALGEALLTVTTVFSESDLDAFEWVEDDKPYREWLLPAQLLNAATAGIELLYQPMQALPWTGQQGGDQPPPEPVMLVRKSTAPED